eukprot:scaffold94974_cov60-Phaeocystis_antarctica.AAC.13
MVGTCAASGARPRPRLCRRWRREETGRHPLGSHGAAARQSSPLSRQRVAAASILQRSRSLAARESQPRTQPLARAQPHRRPAA